MKDFIKFFSIITGLFRSIVSILLLFAIGFVIFVDNHLFLATIDLLGVNNISAAIIKPLALGIFILAFIINTAITRFIFKAGENGKSHLANLFFGLIFLACDAFIYLYTREKLLYILFALNGFLVLNSLFGLIARFRGLYNTEVIEKKTEYIEVKTGTSDKDSVENPIKLDFKEAEEVKILKNEKISLDGKEVISTSQLIDKDTNNEPSAEEELFNSLVDGTVDNKKVNKVVVDDDNKIEETYDPDLADDFKKQEDAKVYDKSNFVGNED